MNLYWETAPAWTKTMFNGKYVSVTSPGTSLFMVPALLIAKSVDQLVNLSDDYFFLYNGHAIVDGILILINSCVFFLIGIFFAYKSLRLLNFGKKLISIAILLSILCSYIVWYVLLYPSMSHIFEFFGVTLLMYSFLLYRKAQDTKYLIPFLLSSGILVLIRPIFVPMVLLAFVLLIYKTSRKKVIRILGIAFVVAIPFILVLAFYNLESYGSIFSSGYSITRGETFSLDRFNGFNLLFSIHRGWLIYSPLFIASIIGLVWLFKKDKRLSILSLGSIVLGVVIYGFWPTWWGGGSFGSRFMLYSLPFCILGLAIFLEKIKFLKYRYVIYFLLTLTTLYSTSLMFLYRVTPINSDFYLPTSFFSRQIELLNESTSSREYIYTNVDNVQSGSGFVALLTGRMDYMMTVSAKGNSFSYKLLTPPLASQQLPRIIQGYLVDKVDKKVYQIEFPISSVEGIFSLENATEVFGIESLPLSEYSGANINSDYDFYLESGVNIQMRGEVIDWVPPQSTLPLFNN